MKRTKLIATRKELGLTQETVAKASGVKRSYYGLIETGVRNPNLKIAMDIAQTLNKSVEELFPEEVFLLINAT